MGFDDVRIFSEQGVQVARTQNIRPGRVGIAIRLGGLRINSKYGYSA
jgi:hypothetical protein